ncbi:MAG: serine hydrolase [Actinobacteria bacterium]|nr:serine hydrolase [Actinomycetota bacterium]
MSDKTRHIDFAHSHHRVVTAIRRYVVLTILTFSVVAAGCSWTFHSSNTKSPSTFPEIDSAMKRRVVSEHLDGAGLLVVAGGTEYRNTVYGSYSSETVIPIASASKWLTAATMMSLVDDGTVSLDDPVSKFLPNFTDPVRSATIRQLLSHTAGIAQASCIWEQQLSLAECVDEVATQKASYPPGTKFSYGNTSFSVAGRIIEVVTKQSFEKAFESRIALPLGMKHTRFDGNYYPTESNPVPAASAESTMSDYGTFVEMIFNKGSLNGVRILSELSVLEMENDSVVGINTSADSAVRTTGIPTYGLGTWRDVVTADDVGVVTSGNGAYGFYPWVDRSRNGFGMVFVYDQRGSDQAVPESQRELHWVLGVLDGLGVMKTATPTTVYRRR